MDLITEIQCILQDNNIYFQYEQRSMRHIFRWKEIMRDAGMAADNVILDFIMDAEHEVLFLGLIRIPRAFRGIGLGAQIVKTMKKYVRETHFAMLLESAPENLLFWQKMHFSSFLYEDYGFWMMGYGGKSKQYFKVKWVQIKPTLYSDAS